MAVGPNFKSPDTQEAIEAQAVKETPADQKTQQNPTEGDKSTPAVEPQETKTPETETGKADLNMDTGKETPAADQDTDKLAEKLDKITDDNLAEQGFNVDELLSEVKSNKGVVPDSVKDKLREKYTDEAIDAIVGEVESQFTNRTDMNTYIFEALAGGDAAKGQENFKTLSEWCKKNMDAGELAAINHLLKSDNKDVVRQGLTQAVNAWRKGQEKPMMSGDSESVNKQPTPEVLEPLHRDEYVEIVASEKYNTDPEYAALIDKRRQATLDKEGSVMTPEYSKYRPVRG